MPTLVIHGASALYTCDDTHRVLRDAWLVADGPRIVALGEGPCPVTAADEVIDAAGCIVLPGFVNLHHHFFQSITRAVPFAQRTHSLDWLHRLYPLWLELSLDGMYWACRAAAAELLLTGATTSADHSYFMPVHENDFAAAEALAAADAGLRLHLVRGSTVTIEGDLEDRLRPLLGNRMAALLDAEERVIPLAQAAVKAHHDPSRFSMLRVDIGPTGITYAKPALMKAYADVARDAGIGLHTHFHPRGDERRRALELVGMTPLDFLREAGWIREGTWMAHCTELNDAEMRAFADAGVGVSHCPRTVIRLGYSVTRISAMRAAGIRVGFGVDGAASNDSGSVISDIRLGLMLHRVNAPPDVEPEVAWMTPYDALLMATRNGAAALRRDDIGALAPGMAADVAMFRLDTVPLSGGLADPLGGLFMAGADARTEATIVNGRVRVRHGQLVDGSEAKVAAEANRCAAEQMAAAGRATGIDFARYPASAAEARIAMKVPA